MIWDNRLSQKESALQSRSMKPLHPSRRFRCLRLRDDQGYHVIEEDADVDELIKQLNRSGEYREE